jgi:hypothetical protein
MKKLTVDIPEIAALAENAEHEDEYYLDVQTGQVVIVPSDFSYRDLDSAEDLSDLPEWERELVPVAREIAAGNERYVSLPEYSSDEAYEQMAAFTQTVTDETLRQRLNAALRGDRPFRRFKNVLLQSPADEKRWFKFKDDGLEEFVRDWLREIGIEPPKAPEQRCGAEGRGAGDA